MFIVKGRWEYLLVKASNFTREQKKHLLSATKGKVIELNIRKDDEFYVIDKQVGTLNSELNPDLDIINMRDGGI